MLAMLGPVLGPNPSSNACAPLSAFFLPLLAFLLGGVAEASVPGASALETCKRVGKVLGACLLGLRLPNLV